MCLNHDAGICALWPGPIMGALIGLGFLVLVALSLTVIHRRRPSAEELMLTVFGSLVAMMIGLAGLIVWGLAAA